MENSRLIDDLLPPVAQRCRQLLALAEKEGIELIITSTFRDLECQAVLYAQGRTAPGKIVTRAKPGDSWHNWQRAFDVVVMNAGKPVWNMRNVADRARWFHVGYLGKQIGLEWGGDFPNFPDYVHFQDRLGRTLYGLKKEAGLIK